MTLSQTPVVQKFFHRTQDTTNNEYVYKNVEKRGECGFFLSFFLSFFHIFLQCRGIELNKFVLRIILI